MNVGNARHAACELTQEMFRAVHSEFGRIVMRLLQLIHKERVERGNWIDVKSRTMPWKFVFSIPSS